MTTETQLNGATPGTQQAPPAGPNDRAIKTLLWVALGGACVSAAVTVFVVRSAWKRRPSDETAERIQSLIDEANRLIRTLEEKK